MVNQGEWEGVESNFPFLSNLWGVCLCKLCFILVVLQSVVGCPGPFLICRFNLPGYHCCFCNRTRATQVFCPGLASITLHCVTSAHVEFQAVREKRLLHMPLVPYLPSSCEGGELTKNSRYHSLNHLLIVICIFSKSPRIV